jgi:hypothetical protein
VEQKVLCVGGVAGAKAGEEIDRSVDRCCWDETAVTKDGTLNADAMYALLAACFNRPAEWWEAGMPEGGQTSDQK